MEGLLQQVAIVEFVEQNVRGLRRSVPEKLEPKEDLLQKLAPHNRSPILTSHVLLRSSQTFPSSKLLSTGRLPLIKRSKNSNGQ